MTRALQNLRDEVRLLIADEGLRPLAARTGLPVGVLRSISSGRDPSGRSIESVCAALDLNFFIGTKFPSTAIVTQHVPIRISDEELADMVVCLVNEWKETRRRNRWKLKVRFAQAFPEALNRQAARKPTFDD